MSLPRIAVPEHTIKLYTQKKPITFRPYLVKEEKILMMAKQSEDEKEVERAVRQVIAACTFDKLNLDKLPAFDLAFLFLQLRAKSVNNVIELRYVCQKPDEKGEACGYVVPVVVNLDDVKLTVPAGHTNKIQLTDDITVTLRYPTSELGKLLGEIEGASLTDLLCETLETVCNKDEVFECAEQPPADVREFVEGLSIPQAGKLREFFDTLPHLEYKTEFKCTKCGHTEDIVLTELADFFD